VMTITLDLRTAIWLVVSVAVPLVAALVGFWIKLNGKADRSVYDRLTRVETLLESITEDIRRMCERMDGLADSQVEIEKHLARLNGHLET